MLMLRYSAFIKKLFYTIFDDVSLVVAIKTLKIDTRNFVLSMENW